MEAKYNAWTERPVPSPTGLNEEEMTSWADRILKVWTNNIYQVLMYITPPGAGMFPMPVVQLSIKRLDREKIVEWRDFQRIKDDILGTAIEAVQIFPASDRLLDTANQYHLWALPAGVRVPWGHFDGRITDTDPEVKAAITDFENKIKERADGEGMTYVGAKQAEREEHHTDEGLPPIGLAGDWWSHFAKAPPTIRLTPEASEE